MNKIKLFKGLEKLLYAGLVVGIGLAIGGEIKESKKTQYLGAGTVIVSLLGNVYVSNKRENLEIEEKIRY